MVLALQYNTFAPAPRHSAELLLSKLRCTQSSLIRAWIKLIFFSFSVINVSFISRLEGQGVKPPGWNETGVVTLVGLVLILHRTLICQPFSMTTSILLVFTLPHINNQRLNFEKDLLVFLPHHYQFQQTIFSLENFFNYVKPIIGYSIVSVVTKNDTQT